MAGTCVGSGITSLNQSETRAGTLANERGGFPNKHYLSRKAWRGVYFTNATLLYLFVQYKMLADVSFIVVTLHPLLTTRIY